LLISLRSAPDPDDDVRVPALFDCNRMFQGACEDSGVPIDVMEQRVRSRSFAGAYLSVFPHMSVALALWREFVRRRPVCSYSWLLSANVHAAPVARLAGVAQIGSSIRNLSWWKDWPVYRQWWHRPADRFAAHLNDMIVGNARAVVEDYRQWSGVSGVPMEMIPNAGDPTAFDDGDSVDIRAILGIDPETIVLLTVGRLAEEKNYTMLIGCWARLLKQGLGFRLLIVGHGDLESRLRLAVGEAGLGTMVLFTGKTSRPQRYYRSADIFVLTSTIEGLTSTIEGMPNVLLEAQSFGLPVVTTHAGGSAEAVADPVTGFVVPVGDEIGFARRTAELMLDPEFRTAMGHRGRARMKEDFTAEGLATAIDRVTGRRPRVESSGGPRRGS
jgi:glycosyltransferase involved in cell wall biosynthesis